MNDGLMPKRVAIMQPTFLPWLGYFALIDHVDAFVYLDDVQLSRQSWQSRNRVLGADGPIWLSLPLRRKPSRPTIAEARLADGDAGRGLVTTLFHALSGAPHRDLVVDIVKSAFETSDGALSKLNRTIVDAICAVSGIETPRYQVGDLTLPEGSARSERLIDMTRALGGTRYLSPPSAVDYLEQDQSFAESEIELMFFNYEHPAYPQRGEEFTPYMSAVEAMAAVGPEVFRDLAASGVRPDNTVNAVLGKEPSDG